MPFQRRNLSYCKGVQYRKWRKSHKKPVASTKPKKPKDLLFDLWKHRVRNYNDAFLSSPRRATRNYAKKTPAKEEKKVIVSNETEPKKLDMLEAKQNGAVTVAEAPKGAHGAPAVAKDKQVAEKKIQTAATDDAVMTESDDLSGKRSCPDSVANLMSEHDGSSLDSLGKQKRRAQQQTISELDEDSYNAVVTWSSKQGDNQGGLIDPQTKVLFHFTYFEEQPNGGAAQLCFQTDATPDNFVGHRRCIFCYFNGGTDTGLLMHCVTSHSDYLDFNAARSEDGTVRRTPAELISQLFVNTNSTLSQHAIKNTHTFLPCFQLHIAVSKKATTIEKRPREFVYVRRPATGARTVPSVPFVKRLPSELATLDVHTRRKNIRLLSEIGADESAVKQFLPNSEVAIRQYYHSRSNEPMLEGEWDVDSDDEEDEDWLTKMSEEVSYLLMSYLGHSGVFLTFVAAS